MANPKVEVDIVADGSKARREVDKTAARFDKFGKGVEKAAGLAGAAAGLGLAGLATAAVQAASDFERSSTTVDRVFGDASDTVKKFAETAAETAGLSAREYQTMAAEFGVALSGMGLDSETLAGKTDELITLAGDMSLALGTSVPEAMEALNAALRGEGDALEGFGVDMDTIKADAEKAARGVGAVGTEAYNARYEQGLLNGVLSGAGAIYGGYREETDTTAESQQNLNAKWDDAVTKLGESLIPIIQTLIDDYLIPLINWIDDNRDAIIKWLPWIAGATAAVWLLNFALAANPIIRVTLLVLILGAALVAFGDDIAGYLIPKLEELWATITDAGFWSDQFTDMLSILGIHADDFATTIDNIRSSLESLWDWFNRDWSFNLSPQFPSVPIVPGGFAAPAGFAAAPALAAQPFGAAAVTSGGSLTLVAPERTTIVVQGALDPDAVARQIDRILTARGRRTRRVIV